MGPKFPGGRGKKATAGPSKKRARTTGSSRQQTAPTQDNDEDDGGERDEEEEDDDDEEEEEEEEEGGGKKSEATTKGGPAASSVKRRQIYREFLMEMIHLVDLAPHSIRSEFTQAGFILTSTGRVVPFFFDVPVSPKRGGFAVGIALNVVCYVCVYQEGSNEYLRLQDAMEDRPEFGATGEKPWLTWLHEYLHKTLKTESYVPSSLLWFDYLG